MQSKRKRLARLVWASILAVSSVNAHAECIDKDANVSLLESMGAGFDVTTSILSCPVSPGRLRGPDEEAKSGGGFNATRTKAKHCHFGFDIEYAGKTPSNGLGKEVMAVAAGKVRVAASDWSGFGNTVIIDHGGNEYSLYGHLKDIEVKVGEQVQSGDTIGSLGYSGNAKGAEAKKLPPHVHFTLFRTLEPLAEMPITKTRKVEAMNENVRLVEGFGFVNATSALQTLSCI